MANKSPIEQMSAPAIAVVTGSFLSGAMMSLTLMAIPVFLDTTNEPAQLYQEWERMYHYGHQVLPGMAIITLLLYIYAAATKRAAKHRYAIYIVAGLVTVAMLPYTWIFMVPTNNTLFALERETKALTTASNINEAQELVKTWGLLHLARSLFPLAGAAIGLTATLSRAR